MKHFNGKPVWLLFTPLKEAVFMGLSRSEFRGGGGGEFLFACFNEEKSGVVSPPAAAPGLLECLLHRNLPSQPLSSSHEVSASHR